MIASSQSNACHVPKNGQARSRPVDPPRANTRFCLDFVCIILRQEGAGSWFHQKLLLQYKAYRFEVLQYFSSTGRNQRVGWSKVVLVAEEAISVESKPPAAVGERISKSERHDFGATAPFSTTTSSLQGRAGGSAFTPKLVEHIESGSTRFAEKLSPCIS